MFKNCLIWIVLHAHRTCYSVRCHVMSTDWCYRMESPKLRFWIFVVIFKYTFGLFSFAFCFFAMFPIFPFLGFSFYLLFHELYFSLLVFGIFLHFITPFNYVYNGARLLLVRMKVLSIFVSSVSLRNSWFHRGQVSNYTRSYGPMGV